LLWVIDIAADPAAAAAEIRRTFPHGPAATIVQNKVDLVPEHAAVLENSGVPVIRLSALTGDGLELLAAHVKELAGFAGESAGTISARTRHVDALKRAGQAMDAARHCLVADRALELAAEELRSSQAALGEITGELSSDDLLGKIFGSFCIGK
jgi:tRNA modification GTPase